MAAETTYEVNAKLQLQGKFEVQMRRASRAIDPVQRKMDRLARTMKKLSRFMGSGAKMPFGIGGMMGPAAAAGGLGLAAAIGAAATVGFRFNKLMEDSVMSIGTMFQMFDVGQGYLDKNASSAEQFRMNMALAQSAQAQLFEKQARTPAGFTDLLKMFQQATPGLAKATKDVGKMTDLMTTMSLMAPALNNDFEQMGRDVARIIGGGAEQEVLTWRLLRGEIFKLTKQHGLLGKNIKNNDQFVQRFNKELSEAAKFALLEEVMKKLGPEFRKMFGESMSGLIGATKSKSTQIAGAFTAPISLAFREAMKRANLGDAFTQKGGLFQPKSLNKLIGIVAYFGGVIGAKFEKFLYGFERVIAKMRDNWKRIADALHLVFQTGAVLFKTAIAVQLGRMAAGGIMGLGGKAVGAAGKVGAWAKKMPTMGKVLDPFAGLGKVLKYVLNPALLATAAIAVVVGVLVAGMAAYIIQNWKDIAKSGLAEWDKISVALTDVYISALKFWNALVIVGSAFLGGMGSVNGMSTSLGVLDTIIWGMSKGLQVVMMAMQALNYMIAFFQELLGSFLQVLGMAAEKIPGMGSASVFLDMLGEDFRKSAAENMADVQTYSTASAMIGSEIERQATARELAKAKALVDLLAKKGEELVAGTTTTRTPGSGVTIVNQINQWDLRQTDPDRIMSAFVPKLEQMADQRTQSYEALDQGV